MYTSISTLYIPNVENKSGITEQRNNSRMRLLKERPPLRYNVWYARQMW